MNKDFDKIFKSKLENHGSSYPADMWDNIDAAINPPKRNTRVWWFTFLVIGVIGLISGVVFLNDSVDSVENSTISELNTSERTNAVTNYDNLTSLEEVKAIEENNSTQKLSGNSDISKKDQSDNMEKISSSQSEFSKLNTTENRNTGEDKNMTSFTVKSDRSNSMTLQSKKSINKRKITFTEPLLSLDTKSQNVDNTGLGLSSNVSSPSTGTNYLIGQNSSINSLWDKTKRFKKEPLYFKNLASLPTLGDLKYREMAPLLDMEVAVAPASSTDCPSWVREKLGLYLEAYYAPEYGVRSLTAKDRDSTVIAHQNSRNDTEKALISYSLGARALFLTPSGISFKLGINYAQINERFTWQDPESIREITIVDTDPMTGDTLNTYVSYEYGTDVEERINRYKSIDLALLIGYEKHYRKKLSFSMNAGIYLNLIAKQRGMFIDPAGDRSWFSSDDGSYDAYKRSIGVSFFASGGLMYHWVDGIDFFAEPSLRFYTQSMTLNAYPLNQNYLVLGIHTGIRYKF